MKLLRLRYPKQKSPEGSYVHGHLFRPPYFFLSFVYYAYEKIDVYLLFSPRLNSNPPLQSNQATPSRTLPVSEQDLEGPSCISGVNYFSSPVREFIVSLTYAQRNGKELVIFKEQSKPRCFHVGCHIYTDEESASSGPFIRPWQTLLHRHGGFKNGCDIKIPYPPLT
ncbi:unnamed protein product [Orchesella dallaii]|uniref:Uncharacterized protein n=1 Tax=Orchesella dallaii TaxID=48710 RepID=A0ABP1RBB4_9HEXA